MLADLRSRFNSAELVHVALFTTVNQVLRCLLSTSRSPGWTRYCAKPVSVPRAITLIENPIMLPFWERNLRQAWRPFAPDYFDLLAPAFVEGYEGPVDAGGEVAEDSFGGGVNAQGWGYEVEAGWFGGEA